MEFHIADTFTDSLTRLTGDELKAAKMTAVDLHSSIRNFPDAVDTFVEATRPLLDVQSASRGYYLISDKFLNIEDFGPTSVRRFVDGSHLLGGRTAGQ